MDIDCHLHLRPIWWSDPPCVSVTLDNMIFWQGPVSDDLDLDLSGTYSEGNHLLSVTFSGKSNHDTVLGKDKAIIVQSLDFHGIQDDRFVWQGIYRPTYPEPWYGQQISNGIVLPETLSGQNYLGWNGVWQLHFTMPIFTWIHQVQDLGWIYD